MKLIIAIISNDDSYDVLSELTKAGFDATKLSTTGGFLSAGNVTLPVQVAIGGATVFVVNMADFYKL